MQTHDVKILVMSLICPRRINDDLQALLVGPVDLFDILSSMVWLLPAKLPYQPLIPEWLELACCHALSYQIGQEPAKPCGKKKCMWRRLASLVKMEFGPHGSAIKCGGLSQGALRNEVWFSFCGYTMYVSLLQQCQGLKKQRMHFLHKYLFFGNCQLAGKSRGTVQNKFILKFS